MKKITAENRVLVIAASGAIAVFAPPAFAQISPDGTLPINSSVTSSGTTLEITGGTRAGGNLFHSFQEFSVPTGGTAFFNNALDVQNIFSRVTGGSISNIDGLIRANGGANLFLINPNGIILGQNARLNIGGSFFASTADSIKLSDGSFYSAANPAAPPLLTINVPIGLQFGQNPAKILAQSNAKNSSDRPVGLQVLPGKTLALVGGDVAIEGGFLTAPGGNIVLGSAAANSAVNLTPTETGFAVGYEGVQNFQDIRLSGEAVVDASGDKSGDIQIHSRRFTLAEGSRVTSFTESQPGGNISVNASDSVELLGKGDVSSFLADLLTGNLNTSNFKDGIFTGTLGSGNGGDIAIATRSLIAQNGGAAATLTAGSGRGGNLTVSASEGVQLLGNNSVTLPLSVSDFISLQFPLVLTGLMTATLGEGSEAGNVAINTPRLSARDLAGVLSLSFGAGKGGNITVNAPEFVNTSKGSLVATIALGAGNAGDIKVATGELNSVNRAEIGTAAISTGNAGSVSIDAGRIFMEGTTIFGSTTGSGQAGNITVNASDSVQLNPRAYIVSQTEGEGNAGNVTINTPRLQVQGARAGATTATAGAGKGGDLTVNASESVELRGELPGEIALTEDFVNSFRQAPREFTRNTAGLTTGSIKGSGSAGNLTVTTRRLTVENGAGIVTGALVGRGGNLTVRASESVELAGIAYLITATLGSERAGDLTIETPQLILRNGAAISADTFGAGDAGNLTIFSDNLSVSGGSRIGASTIAGGGGNGGTMSVNSSEVEVLGTSADGRVKSGLFTNTTGTGNAGDMRIEAVQFTVGNGGEVTASGEGLGAAGNIEVRAKLLRLQGGSLAATTVAGDRGNISLQINSLQMRNNSAITTNAIGTATGGNIGIGADTIAGLENSNITANSVASFAGNVKIAAQGIFLQGVSGTDVFRDDSPLRSDITATSELGAQFDGTVSIQTPNINPTSGLFPAPNLIVRGLIPRGCAADKGNKFTVSGRGGLPPNPQEALRSEGLVENAIALSASEDEPASPLPNKLVEASGIAIAPNGKIVLVAGNNLPLTNPASCSVR